MSGQPVDFSFTRRARSPSIAEESISSFATAQGDQTSDGESVTPRDRSPSPAFADAQSSPSQHPPGQFYQYQRTQSALGASPAPSLNGDDDQPYQIMREDGAVKMRKSRPRSTSSPQQFTPDGPGGGSRRPMSIVMDPAQLSQMENRESLTSMDSVNSNNNAATGKKQITSVNAALQGPNLKLLPGTSGNPTSPVVAALPGTFLANMKSFHFVSSDEAAVFADWINATLLPEQDPDLQHLCPNGQPIQIQPPNNDPLFEACKDGWLLAKLINAVVPGAVDLKLMRKNAKNPIHVSQNVQNMLAGAKKIGVKMSNIGPDDVMKGTHHLILGLIWQIIKIGLLSKVNVVANPELRQLLSDSEKSGDVTKITNETLLIKWVNFHLNNSGSQLSLSNMTIDLRDASIYAALLNQIAADGHPNSQVVHQLYELFKEERDPLKRCEIALRMSDILEIRRLISPNDIIQGNKDKALGFIAQIYDKYPSVTSPTEPSAPHVLPAQIARSEAEKEELEKTNKQLKSDLEQMRQDGMARQQNLDALQHNVQQLDAALQEKDRLTRQQSEQLYALTVKFKELESNSQTVAKNHGDATGSLKSKINALEVELETLRRDLKREQNEKDALASTRNRLMSDIKELERRLSLASNDAGQRNQVLSQVESERTRLEDNLNQVTGERQALETSMKRLGSTLGGKLKQLGVSSPANKADPESNLDALLRYIDLLQQNLDDAMESQIQRDAQNKKLETDMHKLKSQLADAQRANEKLATDEMGALKHKLQRAEEARMKKEAALEELTSKCDSLAREITNKTREFNNEVPVLKDRVAQLEIQLSKRAIEIEQWKRECQNLRQMQHAEASHALDNSADSQLVLMSSDVLEQVRGLRQLMEQSKQKRLHRDNMFDDMITIRPVERLVSFAKHLDELVYIHKTNKP